MFVRYLYSQRSENQFSKRSLYFPYHNKINCIFARKKWLDSIFKNYQPVKELFRHQNCFVVYLHVLSSNASARIFYEKRNFTAHRVLPLYYTINGVSSDGIIYALYMNDGHRKRWKFIILVRIIMIWKSNIFTEYPKFSREKYCGVRL